MFIIFSMFVRATYKLIKSKETKCSDFLYWILLSKMPLIQIMEKINYHYADLIEKEKLLLQNLLKSTKIELKKKKKYEIQVKISRKKGVLLKEIGKTGKKKRNCAPPVIDIQLIFHS